jgi:hypothetical protein
VNYLVQIGVNYLGQIGVYDIVGIVGNDLVETGVTDHVEMVIGDNRGARRRGIGETYTVIEFVRDEIEAILVEEIDLNNFHRHQMMLEKMGENVHQMVM